MDEIEIVPYDARWPALYETPCCNATEITTLASSRTIDG
jgi:hypothetical protein